MQRRLDGGGVFALAYADIDFFKPFNDRYGFSRGDEVIRMLGRLILNVVKMKTPNDSFVGHIGGDDFPFMVPFEEVEGVCGEIIRHFDSIVPSFYDTGDRTEGFIESSDRDGKKRRFSFITVSIGVAHNAYMPIRDYRRLSEVAAEMKTYAKKHPGSCFKVDRRRA
jgi:diguanylate cyclase (GGDEF)-like protein